MDDPGGVIVLAVYVQIEAVFALLKAGGAVADLLIAVEGIELLVIFPAAAGIEAGDGQVSGLSDNQNAKAFFRGIKVI